MKNSSLVNKACVPCQGNIPPLGKDVINKLLIELGGEWLVNKDGHLYKEFKFKNFINAMDFANKVADVAEKEAHHPNITITWGSCSLEIWTHKIDGITENDFILAAKIEGLS